MSQHTTELGVVGQTIQDLLPALNQGFNWDLIKRRYDDHPEGTAMSLHFTADDGEEPVEEVYLGIAEGPRIVILDQIDDRWDYIGAVVTYQDFGMRILDPEDPMDPDRARYQHRGVQIHPAEDESRERVWLVVSNVLEVMLETVIHQSKQQAGASPDSASGADGPRERRES